MKSGIRRQAGYRFFMRNPSKKESVFFVGPIYDKKSLWEFYNRAKVFILTSRFEGYPLVLTEAKRFRNYIVSTELDASEDLLENGKYGCLIAQENYKELALFLEKNPSKKSPNPLKCYLSNTLSNP